jgi:hypothetical protein
MARKPADWEEIRKDYEEKGLNPAALGVKYNLTASTVYQRVKAEGWRKPIEEEVSPEFDEGDEEELIKVDVALHEQKRYLMRLHREIDASTSKLGQMKQWVKEGEAGNIDSRRKVIYQLLSLGNRILSLKNASATLKTIVEIEIAAGLLDVPRGKKAQLEKAARELGEEDDSMFTARKTPKAA